MFVYHYAVYDVSFECTGSMINHYRNNMKKWVVNQKETTRKEEKLTKKTKRGKDT